MDRIEIVQIQSGYWQVEVEGITRPVTIVRSGRRWFVQTADQRTSAKETQHGSTLRLRDAKSLAIWAWITLEKEREVARHEALTEEVVRLNKEIRQLGGGWPLAWIDLPVCILVTKLRAHLETSRGAINI